MWWWSVAMIATAASFVVISEGAPTAQKAAMEEEEVVVPGPSRLPAVGIQEEERKTIRRLPSRTRKEERYTIWEIIHKRFRDPRGPREKDIIWSHESRFHPEFGKMVDSVGDDKDRISVHSLYMSFGILGFVITFIVYSYLQYLIHMHRQQRHRHETHIQMLVKRSAFLLATSGREAPALKRHASILNLFKQFRL